MYPAIQVIPTFASIKVATTLEWGINQPMPDIPTSRTARTRQTAQTVRMRS